MRLSLPASGGSTLITSAPMSPRIRPAVGPATICPISITRIPSSGKPLMPESHPRKWWGSCRGPLPAQYALWQLHRKQLCHPEIDQQAENHGRNAIADPMTRLYDACLIKHEQDGTRQKAQRLEKQHVDQQTGN